MKNAKMRILSLCLASFVLSVGVSAEEYEAPDNIEVFTENEAEYDENDNTETKSVNVNGENFEIEIHRAFGEEYASISEFARIYVTESCENEESDKTDEIKAIIEEETDSVIDSISEKHPILRKIMAVWVNLLKSRIYERLDEKSDGKSDLTESYEDGIYTASVTPTWEIEAENGGMFIESNGRCFLCASPLIEFSGKLFAPIETVMRSFGYENGENEITGGGLIFANEFYRDDEVYWLSKIINAESGTESLMGKVAVGNVVLNRRDSKDFPDTIYSVIWDRRFGVQFSPTENGTIAEEPSEESVRAAKICLEGDTVSKTVMYFVNPKIAESTWVSDNRTFEMTIGNHDFYS